METGGTSEPAAPLGAALAHSEAPVDGRTARAQRTRDAIVEACVTLVNNGDIRPTAPRIAEEAGVSVRSVFQHFDDLETLFTLVAERFVGQLAGLVRTVDVSLPFEERLAAFVDNRTNLLDAVTPIRRAAAVHAPFSPALQARLTAGHALFRGGIERVFAAELDHLDPERREVVLDMLDVASTWTTWELLRTLVGRSREEAVAVVTESIRAALGRPA